MNQVTLEGTIEGTKEIPMKDPNNTGARAFIKLDRDGGSGSDRFSVIAWGDAARALLSIGDGAQAALHGKLRRSSWTDRETQQRRYDTEVVAESIRPSDA